MKVAIAACLVAACTAVGAKSDGSITLAWDRNPESMAGYILYVGVEPNVYGEQFDVGNRTSFVYPSAMPGRRYYFSVAAYSPARVIGPRSAWISTAGGSVGGASSPQNTHAPEDRSASQDDAPEIRSLCIEGAPVACYAVQTLVRTASAVRSVADAPDGTVFFVDDGSAVKVRNPDNGQAIALVASASRRFSGVVVDPSFATTRRVYVGEVDLAARGGYALSIVRYRDLLGSLGEGAAFVTGLPVPDERGAPFSIDRSGGVYVAMPAAASGQEGRLAPYAGSILGFDANGRVPSQRHLSSPILAQGFDEPSALGMDPATGELLVGGRHRGRLPELARFDPTDASSLWPAPLTSIRQGVVVVASTDATTQGRPKAVPTGARSRSLATDAEDSSVLMLAPGNRVFRYDASRALDRLVELVTVSGGEWVTAVSTGMHGDIYLGVAHGRGRFSIVRLEPGTRSSNRATANAGQ